VTSVLGTGASGQVLLFTTVLLGASAVLFTIATIATEQHNRSLLCCMDVLYFWELDPE
jgi:hypothetical protein